MARKKVFPGLLLVASLWAGAAVVALVPPAQAAKNVIILVADGSGFNTWTATSIYQGKVGKQAFDGPGWFKGAVATYPLNQSTKPKKSGKQDPSLVYDPAKAWSGEPCIETVKITDPDKEEEDTTKPPPTKKVPGFTSYVWLKKTYTDSAAAATAMASGVKTYNNAINWSDLDQPLLGRSLAEVSKKAGKSVGVITTVPFNHATPAAFGGAHNITRKDYKSIANEMLKAPYLDVIMGAGNPDFDENSQPRKAKQDYRYVGGPETWAKLKAGTHPDGWKLVESKADFEALTRGKTPAKVVGVAQAASTLQQRRTKAHEQIPFQQPFNTGVPTLATMSRAAIHCLEKNPQGFYLMIEGGAVDWANHARQAGRMIEEQIDFYQAVDAVVAWVEKNSNWEETLVILTADHETGLVWGPDSDTKSFQAMTGLGPNRLPGLKHNHNGHTNSLVPLYARGPGAARFATLTLGTDSNAVARWGIAGQYIDNTSIYTVAQEQCSEKSLPASSRLRASSTSGASAP